MGCQRCSEDPEITCRICSTEKSEAVVVLTSLAAFRMKRWTPFPFIHMNSKIIVFHPIEWDERNTRKIKLLYLYFGRLLRFAVVTQYWLLQKAFSDFVFLPMESCFLFKACNKNMDFYYSSPTLFIVLICILLPCVLTAVLLVFVSPCIKTDVMWNLCRKHAIHNWKYCIKYLLVDTSSTQFN